MFLVTRFIDVDQLSLFQIFPRVILVLSYEVLIFKNNSNFLLQFKNNLNYLVPDFVFLTDNSTLK